MDLYAKATEYAKQLATLEKRINIHEFVQMMTSKFYKDIDLTRPVANSELALRRELDNLELMIDLYATYDTEYLNIDKENTIESLEIEVDRMTRDIEEYNGNFSIEMTRRAIANNTKLIQKLRYDTVERQFRKPSVAT